MGERERVERGLDGRKRKKGHGALGKTAIPFLSLDSEHEREAGRPRPMAAAPPRGSAAAADRGKTERGTRATYPGLTLVGDGLWRWLRSEEWAAAEVSGGGANGGARECCGGLVVR
jgi:hypothetical protein